MCPWCLSSALKFTLEYLFTTPLSSSTSLLRLPIAMVTQTPSTPTRLCGNLSMLSGIQGRSFMPRWLKPPSSFTYNCKSRLTRRSRTCERKCRLYLPPRRAENRPEWVHSERLSAWMTSEACNCRLTTKKKKTQVWVCEEKEQFCTTTTTTNVVQVDAEIVGQIQGRASITSCLVHVPTTSSPLARTIQSISDPCGHVWHGQSIVVCCLCEPANVDDILIRLCILSGVHMWKGLMGVWAGVNTVTERR